MNVCRFFRGRRGLAFGLARVCGILVCGATASSAQTTTVWATGSLRPTDAWNTLSVEMSVAKRHTLASGALTGSPAPQTRYRIERSSSSGSWKTVITVLSVEQFPTYTFSGALRTPAAFTVSRIEDDEDGRPVRVYDRLGNLMPYPLAESPATAATLSRSGGREWLQSFVATTGNKTTRLQNLQRLYGKPTKSGSLNRYLRMLNDTTDELLVDPKTIVTLEKNGVQAGKLRRHRTFKYSPAPDGALVRSAVHSETLVSDATAERAIVDTEFSNIRLEVRR